MRHSALKLAAAWLPSCLYTLLIWYLSSHAVTVPLMGEMLFADKGIHFLEYGALAVFIVHAVHVSWPLQRLRYLAAGWFTVVLGLSDEFHQAFVPGRSAEVPDLVADVLGTLAGLLGYAALRSLVQLLLKRYARPKLDS